MEGDDASIRESAKKKAPKELRERDYDKDGYVSKEEMFRVPEWDADFEVHQKATFDLADMDNDGQLNVTEITVFLHPEVSEYKQQYNEMVAQEHITKVDSDKDGHITWAEHWHDVIHGHDFSKEQIEDLDETEKELFNRHDGDGDGKLTRAELHLLLFPDLETIGERRDRCACC
jgi:Ca2+-binding EF-hand superfamily protein